MAGTIHELFDSRGSTEGQDNPTVTLRYVVRGTQDDTDDDSLAASAIPAMYNGKFFQSYKKDHEGNSRLVAYVVAEDSFDREPVIAYLKDRLPDYMVPSALVMLDSLPRTPGGKVNRLALPAPGRLRADLDEPFIAAQTPVEKVLAGIWSEVLNISEVGTRDNFFELGGHSLLATQVIARLRAILQVELPLNTFFETPTLGGLAQYIDALRWMTEGSDTDHTVTQDGYVQGEL